MHSTILGYAFDGYPIYGPYSFENHNGTGNIILMKPSFQLRTITKRTSLSDGTQLSSDNYGPDVSTQFPLGYYIEDYQYIQDLGDLDEHNGRFCITPEYPAGTYAYFIAIGNSGKSLYPYIIGPTYYGLVPPGNTGPNGGHNVPDEDVATYNPENSVRAEDKEAQIRISPNPAKKFVDIEFGGANGKSYSLWLTDESGKEVFSWTLTGTKNRIDLGSHAKGVYFLRMNNGTKQFEQMIVME